MWFEIIPSFAVVFASYVIPVYGVCFFHKYFLGNIYMRDQRHEHDQFYFRRDIAMGNGNGYHQVGLEAIPDEVE